MKTVIVTGSAGLVGSAAVRRFATEGYRVVGIDNGGREEFFGESASVEASELSLESELGNQYEHFWLDVGQDSLWHVFEPLEDGIDVVIHCAAQPSHDWAAKDPRRDFMVNAYGTLNVLDMTRKYSSCAAFIFMSTNKVYGDWPNHFSYHDMATRFDPWSCPVDGLSFSWKRHFNEGFNENLPIDQCTHSLFGASKLAADVLVQEYGRYFGMNTVCFRAGCITGPAHAGVPQHGFLSYLVKCCMTGTPYQIIGYGGKQVRDNIHASDLASAFVEYVNAPTPGAVYNIGGGPERSCSVLEAIEMVERLSGRKMQVSHVDEPRKGDHKWWVTDCRKFQRQHPNWRQEYTLWQTIQEMIHAYAKIEAA